MTEIKQLYDLQLTDTDISSQEQIIADIKEKISDDSAVITAKGRIQGFEAELAIKTPLRRKTESAIQQIIEKIAAIDKKLYGGGVNNPRELSAFQTEKHMNQTQLEAEEENLLELMAEIEHIESEDAKMRKDLEALEIVRATEIANLLDQDVKVNGLLDELKLKRIEAASNIPAPALATYEFLKQRLNGYAVAKIEKRMCSSCRLVLPTMDVQKSKNAITQCSSCHRILYVA